MFCHQIGSAYKKRHHCLQTPNWSVCMCLGGDRSGETARGAGEWEPAAQTRAEGQSDPDHLLYRPLPTQPGTHTTINHLNLKYSLVGCFCNDIIITWCYKCCGVWQLFNAPLSVCICPRMWRPCAESCVVRMRSATSGSGDCLRWSCRCRRGRV